VQNYHQVFNELSPTSGPAVRPQTPNLVVGVHRHRHGRSALLFAVIIDRGIRGSRIYQSVLFLPVMLSLALIGIIWELIYLGRNYGLINTVIGRNQQRQTSSNWLGNPHLNLWALLVEATWAAGRLRDGALPRRSEVGRPPRCAKRRRFDGATTWQTFLARGVSGDGGRSNIVVLVVDRDRVLARAFDLVYITSNGNPLRGLELFVRFR